jgi:plastocyanin
MPDWSIKIVPSDTGAGAAFEPDLQGAKQGDPLQAQQDDLVSWNNTTKDSHQIGLPNDPLTGLAEDFVTDPIPAGGSSRPSYDTAVLGTINYYCLTHPTEPTERGTIVVSAVPT